jgi:hypothetical protein
MSTPENQPSGVTTAVAGGAPPVDGEMAGRSSVRRRARGMTHHEVEAALEEARRGSQIDTEPDEADDTGRGPAELAEWERIEELLADHEGAYDPDTDAFAQGELAAQANREQAAESDRRHGRGPAGGVQEAGDADVEQAAEVLRGALARAGVMDVFSAADETAADRITQADPAAALAVAAWLDTAFAAGQAYREVAPPER